MIYNHKKDKCLLLKGIKWKRFDAFVYQYIVFETFYLQKWMHVYRIVQIILTNLEFEIYKFQRERPSRTLSN